MNYDYLAKKGITSDELQAITNLIWLGFTPNDLGLDPITYERLYHSMSVNVKKLEQIEREKKMNE